MEGCLEKGLVAAGALVVIVFLWCVGMLFGALIMWVPVYAIWNYGIIHLYPHSLTWSQAFGASCALALIHSVFNNSKSSSK